MRSTVMICLYEDAETRHMSYCCRGVALVVPTGILCKNDNNKILVAARRW